MDMTLLGKQHSGPSKRTLARKRCRGWGGRTKRGGLGFNYTQAMLLIDPATAARIGLTARSKTTPGLFDQVEQPPPTLNRAHERHPAHVGYPAARPILGIGRANCAEPRAGDTGT